MIKGIRNKWLIVSIFFIFQISFAATTNIRGQILHFQDQTHYQHLQDGVLTIQDGMIESVKPYQQFSRENVYSRIDYHYPNGLIMPGFIDSHIHYPQTEMIAMYGEQLLDWLDKYTFPIEKTFANAEHANRVANIFLDELLKHGTTTANIFNTKFTDATDAIFNAAEQRQMRIIAGKVLADQNIPEYLLDSPQVAYNESKQLIEKWHKKPGTRLLYAVTLRFPPSTSDELFKVTELLMAEYPDIHFHSHTSENKAEVEWTKKVHHVKQYTDTYAKFNLLTRRSLLAHGIYLTEDEFARLERTQTNIAHCPTSNLFLGSGLFKLNVAENYHINVGLGTDVGAGTSYSLLKTLNEAYKVAQLQDIKLDPFKGFYLATLGSAKALNLDDKLGNFNPGKEGDVVVLDLKGKTSVMQTQMNRASDLQARLFNLIILGDDRSVLATFVNGQLKYKAS